jgi:hypothetical protein
MDGEQITNVLSDNKVVKLPSVNGMDTWYVGTSGFTGAVNLLSLGTIDYFYDIVVRVGNVPYYAKTPSQFEKKGAILVDVTPGYFSFAPSREELPVGRELEHLLNGVEKLVGKEPTEIAKFYVENGLVDENNVETIMFSSRAIACQEARGIIEHDNFVASQRERFANLNEFLSGKKELFGNGNFACCDISSFKGGKWKTLCNTLNDKELDVNEIVRGWVLDSLKISQAYDSLPMTGSKRFSHYERVLRVNKSVASYVFTGVKETRTGKFKVPSEYRKTLLTERVKEDMRKIRADVWKTVSPVQHSQYVLFVKEGVTLTQEQLNVLSLLSPKYSETITSYVEPVTEQIKYVEKSSKQKEGNASVSIFDRVYDVMVYPSYIDRQCEVQELSAYEVIEKYAGKDYFVVRNDVFSFEFLQTVSVLSSRKIIEIRTGNKKVFEKLNLSGIPALFGENEEILKQLEENIGIDKKYVDCFKINNRDRLAFSIDMMDEKLEQEFILEHKNEILTAIATSSVFCQYDNSNFLERNKKYLSIDFQVPERYIYGSWLTQAVNGWHERDAFTNRVFETVFDMQKYYEENEEWVNETAYLELIDFVNDRYNRSVENLVTIVKELEPEWSQKLFGTQGRVNHVGSDFEQIEPLKNYCFKRIQENTNSKFVKRVNAMKQLANLDCIKEDIKCGKNTIANVLSSYEKTPSNKYAACLKSMIDAEIEDVVKSNPL